MRLLAFTLGVLMIMGGCYGCAHELNEETRRDRERERDWLIYSQAHHCKVSHIPGFFEADTTWDCDGFQVVRSPR